MALLLFVVAAAIAVSGGGRDDCPSAGAVVTALQVRMSNGTAMVAAAAPAGGLRLVLQPRGSTSLELTLLDDGGQTVLRRSLPSPRPARAADCAALAETIALIIDRYGADVQAVADADARLPPAALAAAPPAPGPPPVLTDIALVGGGSWRSNGDALEGFETLVGLDLQRAAYERGAGASLTIGIAPLAEGRWSGGRATLRRIPIRLGTYLSLAAGPGRLEPGLNLGIDTLLVDAQRSDGSRSGSANASPNVEAAMAYRVRGGIYFARAAAAAGLAVPYRLTGLGGDSDGAVSTPRTYVRIGVETGFYFR